MPPDTSELTTCVIPCYNHGQWVAQAVGSCLDQRGAPPVEVVLVDDGSDDASTPDACQALAGPRVRVLRQDNAGLPAARNAGARLARGRYLVFLDADDWIEPTFVQTLHQALSQDPQASHAYCQERLTDLGQGVVWRVPAWDPITLLVTNLHPVTCLVRRDRFEAVGGFDPTMRQGYEDWDLWLRFAECSWHGVRVQQVLFNWRRHAPQTMIDRATAQHEALYRRLLENHRAFFERHALDAAVRANAMLRAAEGHWIDDAGVPIELRYLRAVRDAYAASPAVALARRLGPIANLLPAGLKRRLARWATAGRANTIAHPAVPATHRTPPSVPGK